MILDRAGFRFSLAVAVAIHVAFGLGIGLRPRAPEVREPAPVRLEIFVSDAHSDTSDSPGSRKTRAGLAGYSAGKTIDLRPSYMRGGTLTAVSSPAPSDEEEGSGPVSRDLLQGDPRIASAFDGLAARIDHFVEYPSILIENGIQGVAALDLYFDSRGEVDESRSRFSGDHRALRGVLARASRKGIEGWYLGEGSKLSKEQFRNQHFRAEFSLSYLQVSDHSVQREGMGRYKIIRRHSVPSCASPMGVDLACLALKGYGLARKHLSEDYKGRAMAVIDVLERYDEAGLTGINDVVRRNRGKI